MLYVIPRRALTHSSNAITILCNISAVYGHQTELTWVMRVKPVSRDKDHIRQTYDLLI